ncbi:MAG: cytochrome C assembly family protein [Oceanipulchritudo sp.]
MNVPDQWLLLIGTMAYVAALVLTLVRLSHRREPMHGTNLILILAGWLMQTTGLWLVGIEAGSCPIRNPFEVLQFVSWSIVLLYLFTGQVFRLSMFGTGSASLAAIIGILAFLMPGAHTSEPTSLLGGDPRIEAHAALALFSYGIFGLLAVLSALYLLQNNSLKTKRNAGIFRFLPPLVEMDTVLFRLLIMACVVYTVSVGIGALYWTGHLDEVALPKLIFTLALWIAYWVVLLMRAASKLFGTRLAWTCIFLLIAALLILWPVEASRVHSELVPDASRKPLLHNVD